MTISKLQTFDPDARFIPFIDEGEGATLVLLPGQGLSIGSLGTLASVLEEEGFRVVRIGYRRPSDAPVTLHDIAQDVVDVLDHLDLPRTWIGGHAFGGAVARTIALDHPGRAEGVLLLGVEGTGARPDDATRALRTAFSDASGADIRDAVHVLAGGAVDPGFAADLFSHARDLAGAPFQADALAATPEHEWAELADRIPVGIIQGSDDRVTVPANGEALRASAPTRTSLATIEGAGHLFVMTHPGEIGAEIEDYLGWD